MKELDIHVINGREFDLNSYKTNVSELVKNLLSQYQELLNDIETFKNKSNKLIGIWALTKPEKLNDYYNQLDKLLLKLEDIESQLINLDDDFRSHKGITLEKIVYALVRILVSDWTSFALGCLALYIFLTDIMTNAILKVTLNDALLSAVFFFKSRNIIKKGWNRLKIN